MTEAGPPLVFDVPFDARHGRTVPFARSFDAESRAALAAWLGVERIDSLTAAGEIAPDGPEAADLTLRVEADIVQLCTVTLAPVPAAYRFDVRRRFQRQVAPDPLTVDIDPEADDPPEVLPRDRIPVGAIIAEDLSLALDPYPRAPDATLSAGAEPPPEARESPFAVLLGLSKPPGGT